MTTRLARTKRVLTMDANEAIDPLVRRLVLLFRRYPWQMHALGLAVNGGISIGAWVVGGPKLLFAFWALVGAWVLVVIVATSVRTHLSRNR